MLKKSITNVLIIYEVILFVLLSEDTNNLKVFIISKIILLTLAIINALIIEKYGYKERG